jgi:hypothetical protein
MLDARVTVEGIAGAGVRAPGSLAARARRRVAAPAQITGPAFVVSVVGAR